MPRQGVFATVMPMPTNHRIRILIWGDDDAEAVRRVTERVLDPAGRTITGISVVPADQGRWERAVEEAARAKGVDCLLTVGGAGFAAREIVPDVCLPLISRLVPGLPEAIREAGYPITPLAALFRGTAGLTAAGRLIVNLPAEERWLEACLLRLAAVLGHALDKAGGDMRDCGPVA